MKRPIIATVLASIAAVALLSCNKTPEISTASVTVNVALPEGFSSEASYTGNVILKDRNSAKSYTATASEGVAVFPKVAYGVYDASASLTLTNEQFREIATEETAGGITSSVNLNGYVASVTVTSETSSASPVDLTLSWSVPSSLVISKIYNFGTQTLAGKAYNIDKYVEIFNNSDEVQYADSLYLAEAYGSAVSSPATVYPGIEDGDAVYLQRVVRIPGNGTQYPIAPGKSIVIAQNAMNHIVADVVTNTVDLIDADFECYVEGASASMFPSDNTDVPNIEEIFGASSAQAKFFAGQGTVLTIFRMTASEFEALETKMGAGYETLPQYAPYCKVLPADRVLDGVDLYRKGYESRRGKHLPLSVDASYAACDQRCISERKIAYTTPDGRIVLRDTNNSAADFVLIAPVDNEDGAMVTPANLTPRDYTKPEIR